MKSDKSLYHRNRFPREIIRHAVWLYYQFSLSYRDVEDLLAERGITVSYETVGRWCIRFCPTYTDRLRKRSGPGGDQWFVDEVFVRIDGQLRYLYRAVDQHSQVLGYLAPDTAEYNSRSSLLSESPQAARPSASPSRDDKLKSHRPAHRDVMPAGKSAAVACINSRHGPIHATKQWTIRLDIFSPRPLHSF